MTVCEKPHLAHSNKRRSCLPGIGETLASIIRSVQRGSAGAQLKYEAAARSYRFQPTVSNDDDPTEPH